MSWSVVLKSSTEAESKALSHGALKLIWVKSLLSELGYKIEVTLVIWCDSMNAITLA